MMEERVTPRSKEAAKDLLYSTVSGEGWDVLKYEDLIKIKMQVEGTLDPLEILCLVTSEGGIRMQGIYLSNATKDILLVLERHLKSINRSLEIQHGEMYTPFDIRIGNVLNLYSLEAYIDIDYRYISAIDFSFIVLLAISSHEMLYQKICQKILRDRDQILKELQNSSGLNNNIQNNGNSYTGANQGNSGCYIATAVYGSYDCPEVWTLRRYRDYTLAETWYGKIFIKFYYAVSPTLVKWFGNECWFKMLWKKRLDKIITSLQEKGVESSPYEDRF